VIVKYTQNYYKQRHGHPVQLHRLEGIIWVVDAFPGNACDSTNAVKCSSKNDRKPMLLSSC